MDTQEQEYRFQILTSERFFVASVSAVIRNYVVITEDAAIHNARVTHMVSVIACPSYEDAVSRTHKLARETYPGDDEWEIDVLVCELSLSAAATFKGGQLSDGEINVDLITKPK